MEETREERIGRLTREFRGLLEERFPEKGSTLERIEELTEESATKQEGTGYVGGHATCECEKAARFVRIYEKEVITLHGVRMVGRPDSCRR